jgi:hypothetical protein
VKKRVESPNLGVDSSLKLPQNPLSGDQRCQSTKLQI